MSAAYKAVSWTRNKIIYDGVALLGIGTYLSLYLLAGPRLKAAAGELDEAVLRMHAFGTCAFLLLTCILAIGPLARLDRRFLLVLYNRRHLGVMTAAIAACHAYYVLSWYFAFSPTPAHVALFAANTSYDKLLGFPFELLGVAGLSILVVMAATSHDFWLSFLTPKVWKALHMLVYLAYGLIVVHVALGALQSHNSPLLALVVMASVTGLTLLHLMAARQEHWRDGAHQNQAGDLRDRVEQDQVVQDRLLFVGLLADLKPDRALVATPTSGERIAVYLHQGRLSAISNVCAHQQGPLGEGRIVDGLVTCPWHGFQYRLEDGCAPPPYREKLATYQVHLRGNGIYVDPQALPLGSTPEPVLVPNAAHTPLRVEQVGAA